MKPLSPRLPPPAPPKQCTPQQHRQHRWQNWPTAVNLLLGISRRATRMRTSCWRKVARFFPTQCLPTRECKMCIRDSHLSAPGLPHQPPSPAAANQPAQRPSPTLQFKRNKAALESRAPHQPHAASKRSRNDCHDGVCWKTADKLIVSENPLSFHAATDTRTTHIRSAAKIKQIIPQQ